MFDREKASQYYLQRYSDLWGDERKLNLLLVRSELLSKNGRFIAELNQLDRDNQENVEAFKRRWHADPETCLSLSQPPAVTFQGGDYERCTIKVEIDVRYSKKQILEEIGRMYDSEHEYLLTDGLHCVYADRQPVLNASGNQKTDLEDIRKYIAAYQLRAEGKTWSEIQNILDLDSLQIGRNWEARARVLIECGLPTLPAFPIEPPFEMGDGYGCDEAGMPLNPNHPWNRETPEF